MINGKRIIFCLIIFMILIAACGQKVDTSEPLLEIVGYEHSVSLTRGDLETMSAVEGWSGTISSTGLITAPMEIKGVSLTSLADLVGGLDQATGIKIVAKDGYSITMSYDQIIHGAFTTYDPGTGDEIKFDEPLMAVVAYEISGESIPEDEDGPLRIFIVSEKNNQLVDGHWSVKWVEKLELKPLAEDWVLYLEGTITEDLDRASFESCTAPGCHVTSWEDSDGNIWSGVPLYLLAGRVDDDNVHEKRAYNDDFAEAGYALEIFAQDGYSIEIESSQSSFNQELILASSVNADPLGEGQFPLKLVGDDLERNQMINAVAQIVIVPNEGVEPPSAEDEGMPSDDDEVELSLPEGAALVIAGKVRNQLVLTLENFEDLGVIEVEISHPKKGSLNFRGVQVNTLLSLAGMNSDSSLLVIEASDGYQVELPLVEVRSCESCLVAIQDEGSLSMAMEGMESGFWVKDVVYLIIR